ncbi:MAG: FtsX-like permease family protein [Kibdelosporangium sp.]
MRTLRFRKSAFVASFVAMLAGAALVMACAGLLETGLRSTGDAESAERITILASVFSSWTTLATLFGVSSTIALTVLHRRQEIALLRAIGTTGQQVRRMVVGETMVLAVVAAALAYLPSRYLGGRLFDLLADNGVIAPTMQFSQSWLSTLAGAGVTLGAALGAALIASRRGARTPPVLALAEVTTDTGRLGRVRVVFALLSIATGLSLGVVTALSVSGPYTAATAGPAGIWVCIGLALLAPAIVRGVLPRSSGALAIQQARVQFRQLAAAVVPVVMLAGIGLSTLYMQATEDFRDATLATANYAVVSMIIGFAALTTVNTLVAATSQRRRELGLLRLSGCTRGQVLRTMGAEGLLVAAIGLGLGAIASLATVVPFSLAKRDSVLPSGSPWILVAVVGFVGVITLIGTLWPAWRGLRGGPIAALGR